MKERLEQRVRELEYELIPYYKKLKRQHSIEACMARLFQTQLPELSPGFRELLSDPKSDPFL